MENTIKSAINENYLNVLIDAVKSAINEKNGKNIVAIFANLKKHKTENPDQANEIQKYFNSKLTKLEIATAKQLGKSTSTAISTSETAKNEFETLCQSIEAQRKKVKNLLSGYIATDRKTFTAKFTKTEILTRYDKLTNEEFAAFYRGASITAPIVFGAIVKLLDKENKQEKH